MAPLNSNLQKLLYVAQKPERLGIGLMSGTSLDGLDIALCRFSGHGLQTRYELLHFLTIPYTVEFKQQVKQVFAGRQIDLELLCLLNASIGTLHADMVLSALHEWNITPQDVDYIASHGQTVYHAPKRLHHRDDFPDATLQIGDGDHIAAKTGILTISDFRQKHIAAGGEGAPLALYGDVILGSKPGEDRILLNLGGIANLTYLPADGDSSQIICTDVGPANTLIDATCRQYFNQAYDEGGQIAASGQVNEVLLQALLEHPFFTEPAPKTTGQELFSMSYLNNRLNALLNPVSPADLVCTLSHFTAKAVADFINSFVKANALTVLVSGGGSHNTYVMNTLAGYLPQAKISSSSAINLNPDAKEAVLFALLGNEFLTGEPLAIGTAPATLMGKLSFPK
ncbi:anhydro-N-acetylmuramic acid kinase AnmK [Mucilaginibacter koreensis]